MKEYGIYRINNGCKPFLIHTYKNVISAKLLVDELVAEWERKQYKYYVDNDYYKNKFPHTWDKTFYVKIVEREISEWKSYNENSNQKNNIIYFI